MAVNYMGYIRVKELLEQQIPLSTEHDETLFIIIHQVYELWFKQLIHETAHLGLCLNAGDITKSMRTMKRMLTILKTLVGQVDILETMSPLSFNSFRARLETASGFQSVQFRQLELMWGFRGSERFAKFPPEVRQELQSDLESESLFDQLMICLGKHGYVTPKSYLARDRRESLLPNQEVQDLLVKAVKENSALLDLTERFVDLDEGFQEWRYRHMKMAQRTIGGKIGTGNSAGADYLKNTVFIFLFPDLWAIRSQL